MYLNDEYVTLKNTGDRLIDMTGWSLSNKLNDAFTFPDGFDLPGGATVTVYTGCGVNTTTELYWCSPHPVWANNSDRAVLKTASGTIIDQYAYYTYAPRCKTCGDSS